MWRQLAYKELRETGWIGGLALLAYYGSASLVGFTLFPWTMKGGAQNVLIVAMAILPYFVVISAILAAGLGIRQTIGESARGTWLFLLHRPTARWKLVAVKLAVGLGIYLACAAAPILAFGWWAVTPGTHASPFEWGMLVPGWLIWLAITAAYSGAFLSGLRPARWVGSRLFPLVGAGLIAVIAFALGYFWPFVGLAIVLVLNVWLVACILFVAQTRDFS
jgi:hypothetical protein